MNQRLKAGIAGAVLLGGATVGTVAMAAHSLSDIATTALREMERRATASHYEEVEIQVRPLDARLDLADCGQPLRVLPETTRRTLGPVSVGIRCDGPAPWTLYVRGQVSAAVDVPVMIDSVARGDILGSSDVALERRRINREMGTIFAKIDDIVGQEAKRDLPEGTTVRHSDLRAPELVARGSLVTLIAGGGPIQVAMEGKAMASGAAGDRILVKNISSGRQVEGVIAKDGSVVVQ